MTILNDVSILSACIDHQMIAPYEKQQVREVDGKRVISYGLSSFGYDARVADEIKIVVPELDAWGTPIGVIDPKAFDESVLEDGEVNDDGSVNIPAGGFALARTVEYFRIPSDVMVICLGKSTYARCGLIVNVTPLEPGWEGNVTLELSNTTPLPIKVYPNEGICQFLFLRGERPAVTYGDRNDGRGGKYQGQRNITVARL